MPNLYQQLQQHLRTEAPPLQPSPIADIPELANYMASKGTLSWLGNVPQALGAYSEEEVRRQREAAEAARQNRAAALKTRLAQLEAELEEKGYGQYRRVPKEDGGFDFFDAEGRPITAQEYAKGTKKTLESVLAGSSNPQDIKFLTDVGLVRGTYEAISKRDINYLEKFNQNLLESGVNPKTVVPEDLARNLTETYPSIFQSTFREPTQRGGFSLGRLLGRAISPSSLPFGGGAAWDVLRRRR